MQTIATRTSRVFLREHPVITQRLILHSTGELDVLLAGSVIGVTAAIAANGETPAVEAGKHLLFGTHPDMTPVGILQTDVTVPAEGDAWGTVYVHCAAIAEELLWAEGTSVETQAIALALLRNMGVFVE